MAPLMTVDVREATAADRLPLYRMLELYQHDLSDIWDQDLDAHGEYGYALDRYWREDDCHPFVAFVEGRYAGFALVDGAVKIGVSGHWMDQFCILKKYRRQGIGAAVAIRVFAELPGQWEVGQMMSNQAARVFWQRVIARAAASGYVEHTLSSGWWQGTVQCFESGG